MAHVTNRSLELKAAGLLLALALLCTSALQKPSGALAAKAVSTTVPLPDENEITITRIKLTSKSGAKLKSSPKVKLKKASQLPDGVSVFATLAKSVKRKKKTDAYIVVVRPRSSISAAPASLKAQGDQDVDVSIKGKVPLKAKGSSAENIVSNDRSKSSVCGGFIRTEGITSTVGDTVLTAPGATAVAKRRCRNQPAFSVSLEFPSWTHHKPTQDETLVCALVSTDPVQADAANHAFFGRETGLGFPTIANGPGTLSAGGTQNVSFAVQQAGTYRISVWVNGTGGIAQSGNTTIVVPSPELNGPSQCS